MRIDFFRGLALLVILIDHVEMNNGVRFVQAWTLMSLGFSDMAEAFVFLSGYAAGYSFIRRAEPETLCKSLKRSVKRSARIYVAYLLALTCTLALGFLLESAIPQLGNYLRADLPWSEHAVSGLLFSNHPSGFAILGFYFLILPVGALQIWLLRRNALLAWLISIQLYLFSQCYPDINISTAIPQGGTWYMNTLAWQFLYFAGLSFGAKTIRIPEQRLIRWTIAMLSAIIVLVGLLVSKDPGFLEMPPVQIVQDALRNWLELTNKRTLGPIRVLHFASLAYLVCLLSIRFPHFAKKRLAAPCVIVGQRPLLMYCTGLFMSFASIGVCHFFGRNMSAVLMLHFDFVLASILIASCFPLSSTGSLFNRQLPSSGTPDSM